MHRIHTHTQIYALSEADMCLGFTFGNSYLQNVITNWNSCRAIQVAVPQLADTGCTLPLAAAKG